MPAGRTWDDASVTHVPAEQVPPTPLVEHPAKTVAATSSAIAKMRCRMKPRPASWTMGCAQRKLQPWPRAHVAASPREIAVVSCQGIRQPGHHGLSPGAERPHPFVVRADVHPARSLSLRIAPDRVSRLQLDLVRPHEGPL